MVLVLIKHTVLWFVQKYGIFMFFVLNAIFNNISVIFYGKKNTENLHCHYIVCLWFAASDYSFWYLLTILMTYSFDLLVPKIDLICHHRSIGYSICTNLLLQTKKLLSIFLLIQISKLLLWPLSLRQTHSRVSSFNYITWQR